MALAMLAACGADNEAEQAAQRKRAQFVADSLALKVAVTPTLDCLPLYLAQQEGWFQREGVSVLLMPFQAQMDQDTALLRHHVEGLTTDRERMKWLQQQGTAVSEVATTTLKWQLISNKTGFTVEQMKSSLAEKRNMRRSIIGLVAAVAIALLCVWIYVDWMPQRSDIEFLEQPKKQTYDPFDQPYDPEVQMVLDGDTINITDEDMEMYTHKAEQIFRKRFESEAEEKISNVFDKVHRGANEKTILADSKQMQDELEELKSNLAEDMGISSERAEEIAKEIIDEKMAKKKKELEKERVDIQR